MEFAAFEELETSRLVLRRIRPEDVQDYYDRLGSREAVTRYMTFNPHRDISESIASVQKALRRYEEGKYYRWAVAPKEDRRLIGVIDLLNFDESRDTCSFAYMLAEEAWGRGYGTEALKAALEFAFVKLKVSAVEADHMAENAASGAVMRKAGMKYMGTVPRKYEKNGVSFDAPQYRITLEEWKNKEKPHG